MKENKRWLLSFGYDHRHKNKIHRNRTTPQWSEGRGIHQLWCNKNSSRLSSLEFIIEFHLKLTNLLVSMSCFFYAPWLKSSLFVDVFGLLFGLVWLSLALPRVSIFLKFYLSISCRSVIPVKLSLLVSLCSVSCSFKLSLSFVSCRLIKSHKISCQVLTREAFFLITHHEAFFCSVLRPMK